MRDLSSSSPYTPFSSYSVQHLRLDLEREKGGGEAPVLLTLPLSTERYFSLLATLASAGQKGGGREKSRGRLSMSFFYTGHYLRLNLFHFIVEKREGEGGGG